MNKQIQYRAWHIKEKRMMRVYSLNLTRNGCSVIASAPPTKERPHEYRKFYPAGSVIVMAFTGLHDETDREIYEGDIVRTRYGIYEIAWSHTHFQWRLFNVHKHPANAEGEAFYGNWICAGKLDKTRVIGDIYENPEILPAA